MTKPNYFAASIKTKVTQRIHCDVTGECTILQKIVWHTSQDRDEVHCLTKEDYGRQIAKCIDHGWHVVASSKRED